MASHEELQGAEKDLNNVLMIKEYIVRFRGLRDVLEAADCTSQLLKSIVQKCSPDLMAPITALIEETIEQQATYSKAPIDIRNNRMWAVKVCGFPVQAHPPVRLAHDFLGPGQKCVGRSSPTISRSHQ
jgi:DNA mismatch repair protein MSH4